MYKVVFNNPYTIDYTHGDYRFHKGMEYKVPDHIAKQLDDKYFLKFKLEDAIADVIKWKEINSFVQPSIAGPEKPEFSLTIKFPTMQVENGYGSFIHSLITHAERAFKEKLNIRQTRGIKAIYEPLMHLESAQPNDVVVQCDTPYYYEFPRDKFRVGFTMIEATGIPKRWVTSINQKVDLILVPSRFCRDVFISCGVTVPIRIVPLAARNAGEILTRPVDREVYTFLSWGQFSDDDRKGWRIAVSAFMNEFKKEEKVKLVLKAGGGYDFVSNVHDDRIICMRDWISMEAMKQLIQGADCGVFPTHGEGWGLCPMEAAASGLPTIVTNWSGMNDWVSKENFYPIEVSELEEAYYPRFEGENMGYWALVDEKKVQKQMRFVFENKEAAKQRGTKAANYIKKFFNWDNTVRKMIEVINEELKKRNV